MWLLLKAVKFFDFQKLKLIFCDNSLQTLITCYFTYISKFLYPWFKIYLFRMMIRISWTFNYSIKICLSIYFYIYHVQLITCSIILRSSLFVRKIKLQSFYKCYACYLVLFNFCGFKCLLVIFFCEKEILMYVWLLKNVCSDLYMWTYREICVLWWNIQVIILCSLFYFQNHMECKCFYQFILNLREALFILVYVLWLCESMNDCIICDFNLLMRYVHGNIEHTKIFSNKRVSVFF